MPKLKVSIETLDGTDKSLYELETTRTLEDLIKDVCDKFEMPYTPGLFGLKILNRNDGKSLYTYITRDNFDEVKDGYFLKIVYSLGYLIKRIFENIDNDYKERSFQDLYELSVDPEFIKEIVKAEKHTVLLELFTNTNRTDYEATACLIAIVHLFQKHHITDITQEFLDKIISIIKSGKTGELLQFALSVVHKILLHRGKNFARWKEETIKALTIRDMMDIIKANHNFDLNYGALLVINSLVRSCKGDKRLQLIKEIASGGCKDTIYENIITPKGLSKTMAHELYIYQWHLLSLHAETLNTIAPITGAYLPDEFTPPDSEIKKMTILMDFEEPAVRNKTKSLENLVEYNDIRISLASMSSRYSEDSRYSSRAQSAVGQDGVEIDNIKPSLLTIEALRHYKRHHQKNFCQSQVEEAIYQPGIITSSERVVRLLAEILDIGADPDKTSTCYQPTVFTCSSSSSPFFFELFSRVMWLLSKTRREMKASTLDDYNKVMYVLAKQVKLVLEEKPADLKKMTQKFAETTYQTVMQIWQKEKEEELRNMFSENPSVKVLKERFSAENEELVFEQRMNYVKNGSSFPKFNDKKINGNFYAKLSKDCRYLLISDYDVHRRSHGKLETFALADIRYVIEGKACPLVKNNAIKDPKVAFTVAVPGDQNKHYYINFKAADAKMAAYWCDALNLLLVFTGKDNRSSYFTEELNELVRMDLVLHLMELQNVSVPKRAPPVPRNPFDIKPPLPAKPSRISSGLPK